MSDKKARNKALLIDQLRKTPIVQLACEKTSLSRASYYRWHKDDSEFAEAADLALSEGSALVNDMAESQLMAAIRDGNMTGIIFWLKHHHPTYATRVQIDGRLKVEDQTLTPEQEAVVQEALRLAGLGQIEPVITK